MLLLDTSGVLAALFPDQQEHRLCAEILTQAEPPLLLSPFVLAELDYLIGETAGVDVELQLLAEIAREAYELAVFRPSDVDEAGRIIEQYRDLGIGLADASLVVLSHRHGTRDLLSLDERHFRVLQGAGGPFRLLPADRTR